MISAFHLGKQTLHVAFRMPHSTPHPALTTHPHNQPTIRAGSNDELQDPMTSYYVVTALKRSFGAAW